MPELVANPRPNANRPWLALVSLVAAHAAFNVFLNPMSSGPSDEFPALMWIGIVFVQPVLFATWVVFGPPPAHKRIPLTVAAFVLTVFAGCIRPFSVMAGTTPVTQGGFALLVLPLTLFVAATIAMLIVRATMHWKIERNFESGPAHIATSQFSVKYLLTLTAICAVLLGIGRGLASTQDWTDSPTWQEMGQLFARIGIVLLAIFPAILVPMIVMSPRVTLLLLLVTAASWAVLAWLAIETIVLVDGPPRYEVTYQLALVHLGGALASLGSALVMRFVGYRMVRHSLAKIAQLV